MAADRADAPARFCQRARRMAPDQSRGAEDGDKVAHAVIPEASTGFISQAPRDAKARGHIHSVT
jgi:hypothetical protein